MAAPLFLPRRARQSLPSSAAFEIDWSNPITRGLEFAAAGDFVFDAATGSQLARSPGSGSITSVVTAAGQATAFTGNAVVNGPRAAAKNGDLTVLFIGNPSASAISQAEIFRQSGASGQIWLGANTDENEAAVSGQLAIGLLQTGVNRSSVKAAGATDGTMSCYLVKKSAGSGSVFKNGKALTTVTTGTLAGAPTTTADTVSLGGSSSNSGATLGANLLLVLVFNRAPSDAECASLTANPAQVFRAPRRAPLYLAAGGPTYTLTAASGAIPISGAAAILKAARKLTAASGAVAIAGASAGLTASRKLSAGAGSLPIAGNAAALKTARKLVAGSGQINISGAAANLVAARRLSAASSAIPIVGSTAGLRAARKLTAASGALAIVGRAANLVYTPISGATYTLSCGSGAMPISGGSASLIAARKLVASSGALSIAGQAAGLRVARRIVASGGSISLVGGNANLRAARRLTAGGGSLAINGAAAVLQYSGAGAITDPGTYVSPARTVTFEGLGSTTPFEGFKTTVAFEGYSTLVRF